MQAVLTEQNVKFITDSRGRKKEVILSYRKFRELQYLLDEILPDRAYDLTDAIIEGVKEIGCIQREKSAAEMQSLGEFLEADSDSEAIRQAIDETLAYRESLKAARRIQRRATFARP